MRINWDKIHEKLTPEVRGYLVMEEKRILFGVKPEDVVLNVGCGYGRILNLLKAKCLNIVGIDTAEYCVKKCEEKFRDFKNIKVFRADIADADFQNDRFDKIILDFNFLGNISKPQRGKILKEIKRILKTKGKVLGSVYQKRALKEQVKLYRNFGFNILGSDGHFVRFKVGSSIFKIRRFSKIEIKNLLKKFFRNVTIVELGKLAYFYTVEK